MFIPDRDPGSGSWFFTHPGFRIHGSKRHRIRILNFYPSRIPGSKRNRIRIRNTAEDHPLVAFAERRISSLGVGPRFETSTGTYLAASGRANNLITSLLYWRLQKSNRLTCTSLIMAAPVYLNLKVSQTWTSFKNIQQVKILCKFTSCQAASVKQEYLSVQLTHKHTWIDKLLQSK
jgi:hypothetical protein